MKPIQLISQQRAEFALKKIQQIESQKDTALQKQCLTVANSIPAQIQRTGLGQTLAFAQSKKGKMDGLGWMQFYQLLQEWLCQERKIYNGPLLETLTHGDMLHYQQAQAEALALLIWVRKFARAMLKNEEFVDKI